MVKAVTPQTDWSVAVRLSHWMRAVVIFILIGTGFYIADPFTVSSGETVDKFLMGQVRFWHILFGVFLVFLFLWRIYLALFSRFHADWNHFFAWTDRKNFVKQVKFYLLVSKEHPEHDYLYGPVQSIVYIGLFVMLFFMSLTGLILLGAGYHTGWTSVVYGMVKPFENMMGGLAMVRWVHHILMWYFILFIPVHVYMAFWYDAIFQDGTISSMVSGKFFPPECE